MDQPAQIITEPVPAPPPVSVSPQPPVLPKKASKLPLIFLVILTIGIVGVSAFWLGKSSSGPNLPTPTPTVVPTIPEPTPTPDPTAGWKTYTNSTLGFELKYPDTWTTKDFSISTTYPVHGIIELASDIKVEPGDWPSIQIQYWENPDNLTLEQLNKKITSTESGLGPKIYGSGGEWVKVGGVDAYRVKKGDCEPYSCDKISISYKQKVFVLQNYLVIPESIYNQILSTFKFLD